MTSHRCLQACSMAGCWLLVLPNGTRWLWGNLTVYTSSYLYAQGDHRASEVSTPWMPSVTMAAWALGVFLSGPAMKCFGRFGAHLFGIFMFDGGILLSYLSVKLNSVTGLNLAFGAATGIGDGIIGTVIVLVVSEWVDERQGLMVCVVFSSAILGSMANNQLATWYMNPDNLKPQVERGPNSFFGQPSVIRKIPSFFLILLVFSVFFHLLGTSLIRYNKSSGRRLDLQKCANFLCCRLNSLGGSSSSSGKEEEEEEEEEEEDVYYEMSHSPPSDNYCQELDSINDSVANNALEEKKMKKKSSDTTTAKTTTTTNNTNTANTNTNSTTGLSPRQILLTPSFHALWFGSSCSELSKVWLFNYYKIFGLFFISDDHFLTNLGTVMAVVAAVSRSFWGWSTDSLGLKPTVVLCTASVALITDFYFFTPLVSQWLYGVSTLVYGSTISGYSVIEALVIMRLYGKTNFSANYGLVCLPTIATNLAAPLVFQALLDRWGWFPLLLTMSAMNAVAMVALVLLVPTEQSGNSITTTTATATSSHTTTDD